LSRRRRRGERGFGRGGSWAGDNVFFLPPCFPRGFRTRDRTGPHPVAGRFFFRGGDNFFPQKKQGGQRGDSRGPTAAVRIRDGARGGTAKTLGESIPRPEERAPFNEDGDLYETLAHGRNFVFLCLARTAFSFDAAGIDETSTTPTVGFRRFSRRKTFLQKGG